MLDTQTTIVVIVSLISLISGQSSLPCPDEGFYTNPNDCSSFYRCVDQGTGNLAVYQFSCPSGLVFDEDLSVCNWPYQVKNGCQPGGKPPTSRPGQGGNGIGDGERPKVKRKRCRAEGFFRDERNCQRFYRCVSDDRGGFIEYKFVCPAGLAFDQRISVCNWPYEVPGCGIGSEQPRSQSDPDSGQDMRSYNNDQDGQSQPPQSFPPSPGKRRRPQTTAKPAKSGQRKPSSSPRRPPSKGQPTSQPQPPKKSNQKPSTTQGKGQRKTPQTRKPPSAKDTPNKQPPSSKPSTSLSDEGKRPQNKPKTESSKRPETNKQPSKPQPKEQGSRPKKRPEPKPSQPSSGSKQPKTTPKPMGKVTPTMKPTSPKTKMTSSPMISTETSTKPTKRPESQVTENENSKSTEAPTTPSTEMTSTTTAQSTSPTKSELAQSTEGDDSTTPEQSKNEATSPSSSTSKPISVGTEQQEPEKPTTESSSSSTEPTTTIKSTMTSTTESSEQKPESSTDSQQKEESTTDSQQKEESTTDSQQKEESTTDSQQKEESTTGKPSLSTQPESQQKEESTPDSQQKEESTTSKPSSPTQPESQQKEESTTDSQQKEESTTSKPSSPTQPDSQQKEESTTGKPSSSTQPESQEKEESTTTTATTITEKSTTESQQQQEKEESTTDSQQKEESSTTESQQQQEKEESTTTSATTKTTQPTSTTSQLGQSPDDSDDRATEKESSATSTTPSTISTEGVMQGGSWTEENEQSSTTEADSSTPEISQSTTTQPSTSSKFDLGDEQDKCVAPSTNGPFECSNVGFFRDPKDCNKFHRCVANEGEPGLTKYSFKCPESLVFDEKLSICNTAESANPPCNPDKQGQVSEEKSDESSQTTDSKETEPEVDIPPSKATKGGSSKRPHTKQPQQQKEKEKTQGNPEDEPGTEEGFEPATGEDSQLGEPSQEKHSKPKSGETKKPNPTELDSMGQTKQQPSVESGENDEKPPSKSLQGTCTSEGFFRSPDNCHKFYRCVNFGSYLQRFDFDCPGGLVFDERISVCNWPYAAPPCDGSSTAADQTSEQSDGEQPDESHEADNNKNQHPGQADRLSTPQLTADDSLYDCQQEGTIPFEVDCDKFYHCKNENGALIGKLLYCPSRHYFDNLAQACIPEPSSFQCNRRSLNPLIFTMTDVSNLARPADQQFIRDWIPIEDDSDDE